ncbi:MAG: hypothetical protein R3Y33_03665 [Clostridia bacterium]
MFGFNKSKINIQKAEANFKKNLEKEPLEKGDLPAMIIAGLIVTVPIILIGIGIMLLCSWLLIR